MGHLVQYRTAAGEPASHDVEGLDDALALAARLRNDERAEDVRVFAEVPLRFETFVKVSVAEDTVAPAAVAGESAADPAPVAEDAPVGREAPAAASTEAEEVAPAATEPPPGAMPLTPVTLGRSPGMFQGN